MQSPEVDKQLESLEEVFFSWKFERPWLWVRLFEMELSFDPLWNCTIGTCSDFFDLLNITGQESMSQTLDWSKAFNKDLRIMIANITCFHMLLRVSYSKYMAVCACCYYDVFWHIMALMTSTLSFGLDASATGLGAGEIVLSVLPAIATWHSKI